MREAPKPEVDLSRAHMEAEMPLEMGMVRSLKPQGLLDYARLDPSIIATTDPFNRIRYNPESIQRYSHGNQSLMDDVLAHELIHVRQNAKRKGIFRPLLDRMREVMTTPYSAQNDEKEAFAFMENRANHRKDIPLKPKK